MELWHVFNRGVEKRDIVMDDRDRFRFVHGMLLLNSKKPATNTTYLLENIDFVNRYSAEEKIVDIHGWCLMKNHYHLLLSERVEGGLTLFLRKLNVGYANYFNERYTRNGSLFQGRTKKVLIREDAHFLHILHYIHLNPLDFVPNAKTWRLGTITNKKTAVEQLASYRWSSFLDYAGKKNFPTLLTTEFMNESLGNVTNETLTYIENADEMPVPTEYWLD